MGIAAGRLALAFRELKALALRGERSSHCSSYLPIRAFLIIASNPMLVLEFSWTDWLLQLISPGRYGRGRREGTGDGGEPNEKKDGGDGERGERRQGRREETNSQHILAKQQTLSSCSLKRCNAPILLLLPAPSRPRAWQGLAVGWDGAYSGIWVSGVLLAGLGTGTGGGKGLLLSPGERLEEGRAVLPTQPGSAWGQAESHPDAGSIWMHTQIKSWCARNLEAGAVSRGGEIRGGRGDTPQKHLMGRKCPDLALA